MKNGRPHILEKSANSQVGGPEVGRPVGTGAVSPGQVLCQDWRL